MQPATTADHVLLNARGAEAEQGVISTSRSCAAGVGASNLRSLAARGVSIALDDFGTGFASLTHLKSLPIARVKIDRSFIGNIVADRESRSIVDGIVRLSHSLGKSVVVEGVEDEAQLATVRDLNSDIAQGYLFSRPVPCEDVPTLLLRHATQGFGARRLHGNDDLRQKQSTKRADLPQRRLSSVN